MPTRIISWQQLVLENDPDWVRQSLNPVVWEFSNGRRFVDPAQVYGTPAPSNLINDGGVLVLNDPTGWPISKIGLLPNEVWSNGTVVCLADGSAPVPGAAALFFASITADQLLLFGGAGMPTSAPSTGSGQLWNNGNVVCIA